MKPSTMSRLISRLDWSCHYYGIRMTVLSVAARLAGHFGWDLGSRPEFLAFKDRALDRRFCISTVGKVATSDLDVDKSRQEHAIPYQPTSGLDLPILLSCLLQRADLRAFTFVDFGSGKGRVILMASEFPFQAVTGVEFSAALHQIACKNITAFQSPLQMCHDVTSICQDATEFRLPDGPIMAFFFNPFDAVILRRVLDNIEASVEGSPRDVLCIYHNPVHRELFDDSPFWNELKGWPIEEEQWAIYHAGDQALQAQDSQIVERPESLIGSPH